MASRPTQQDFIDDELLRAPLTFDSVIDTVLAQWRPRLRSHNRLDGDPVRALQLHRGDLVAEAMRGLRTAALADLQASQARSLKPLSTPPAPAPPGSQTRARPDPPGPLALSLIDEDDVAVDIEIARCTQTIRQMAEAELRELHTFTSALVNDLNVARDTNPFRPERFVRALWAGLQQVPLSQPMLTAFLHEAAVPLAEALRRGYASASQRLADQGVTPAAHRTIVYGGGTAWGVDLTRYRPPANLQTLHDSMPTPLDALAATDVGADTAQPRRAPLPATTDGPDPQLIELVARLFTAIQDDRALAPQTTLLLERLQPTVLRLALHDATPLDTYDHPVWRFMDHLANDLECSAPAHQARLLGLCRNLVDHLAAATPPEGSHFSWAIVRLAAARRHALAQALAAAAPQIERLQRICRAEASNATATMPLDIGTLDTVPADLMPDDGPPGARASTASQIQASQPGTCLRTYLQGEWRQLTCLWQDSGHELLLLAEPAGDRLWALRQAAFARLLAEGLARPMHVRSLVRRAADKVLRAL
jgi:hypothetical protein